MISMITSFVVDCGFDCVIKSVNDLLKVGGVSDIMVHPIYRINCHNCWKSQALKTKINIQIYCLLSFVTFSRCYVIELSFIYPRLWHRMNLVFYVQILLEQSQLMYGYSVLKQLFIIEESNLCFCKLSTQCIDM